MNLGPCRIPECTLAATGVCLQSFAADSCPNRESETEDVSVNEAGGELPQMGRLGSGEGLDANPSNRLGGSVLIRPEEVPRLPASTTLSLEVADQLKATRRATVIGVVGLPDSGKTACLASMYLLAAKGMFSGFTCVNSETLMAFEEIARGSRRWNEGNPPEQMTAHTEMTDDREAGFLHLRLKRDGDVNLIDLLIPDLPGEWSKALIDQNDTARFEFLKAVSVIWVMVDGRQFIDDEKINYAIYRTECLIERLAGFLPVPRPRLILVSSWRDQGEIPEEALTKLKREGEKWGMPIESMSVASFSNTEVAPGTGLPALIEATLSSTSAAIEFWPEAQTLETDRAVLAFRR